jgi:hypothetical protein
MVFYEEDKEWLGRLAVFDRLTSGTLHSPRTSTSTTITVTPVMDPVFVRDLLAEHVMELVDSEGQSHLIDSSRKRKRARQACDYCRAKKIRCTCHPSKFDASIVSAFLTQTSLPLRQWRGPRSTLSKLLRSGRILYSLVYKSYRGTKSAN